MIGRGAHHHSTIALQREAQATTQRGDQWGGSAIALQREAQTTLCGVIIGGLCGTREPGVCGSGCGQHQAKVGVGGGQGREAARAAKAYPSPNFVHRASSSK